MTFSDEFLSLVEVALAQGPGYIDGNENGSLNASLAFPSSLSGQKESVLTDSWILYQVEKRLK